MRQIGGFNQSDIAELDTKVEVENCFNKCGWHFVSLSNYCIAVGNSLHIKTI